MWTIIKWQISFIHHHVYTQCVKCNQHYIMTMNNTEADSSQIDMLLRSRDYDELDSSLWNDKCDYIELEKCSNLNPNNYNLIVMQLNVRSLLAHQYELCQLLRTTERKNSRIDIVLLCKTFLSKQTVPMVRIPRYTHVGNYRKNKKGG